MTTRDVVFGTAISATLFFGAVGRGVSSRAEGGARCLIGASWSGAVRPACVCEEIISVRLRPSLAERQIDEHPVTS